MHPHCLVFSPFQCGETRYGHCSTDFLSGSIYSFIHSFISLFILCSTSAHACKPRSLRTWPWCTTTPSRACSTGKSLQSELRSLPSRATYRYHYLPRKERPRSVEHLSHFCGSYRSADQGLVHVISDVQCFSRTLMMITLASSVPFLLELISENETISGDSSARSKAGVEVYRAYVYLAAATRFLFCFFLITLSVLLAPCWCQMHGDVAPGRVQPPFKCRGEFNRPSLSKTLEIWFARWLCRCQRMLQRVLQLFLSHSGA